MLILDNLCVFTGHFLIIGYKWFTEVDSNAYRTF